MMNIYLRFIYNRSHIYFNILVSFRFALEFMEFSAYLHFSVVSYFFAPGLLHKRCPQVIKLNCKLTNYPNTALDNIESSKLLYMI